MLYNIMKRASVPKLVNEGVKNLPPIFLKSAENLHEELSSIFASKILSLYRDDEENLAVDLYRLQNGNIEVLSENLWSRWNSVRMNPRQVQAEIRGVKREVRSDLSESMKEEEFARLDKHKRQMRGPISDIEYSGGMFSQEDLEVYFASNTSNLRRIFGSDVSFSRFVDGVLPALAMSPAMVSKDSQNRSLGIAIPKSLLEYVEELIEFEIYDLSASDFVSQPSQKQVDSEIRKYMKAIPLAVNTSVDLEEEVVDFVKSIANENYKGILAKPKKKSSAIKLRDELALREAFSKFKLSDSQFQDMVDKIELDTITKLVYPFIAEALGYDGEDELDLGLMRNREIQAQIIDSLEDLANSKFQEETNELYAQAKDQLANQESLTQSALNGSNPIKEALALLKTEEITFWNVRKTIAPFLRSPRAPMMKSIFSEVLSEIDIQPYVDKQVREITETITVKKNGKEVEEEIVTGIALKRQGRKKLEKEISKVFGNQSNAFTTSILSLALGYVLSHIKANYVDANGLDTNML